MQLHQIQPKHKLKKSKRIGRGGKRGSSSGRGMKGQKSRAGRKLKPAIRELIKRYPKLKGPRQRPGTQKPKIAVLTLEEIEKNFKAKERISPEILLEKNLVHKTKGRTPRVKILSKGKVSKSLIVENCQISKSAKEKIEKAGGIIETKN